MALREIIVIHYSGLDCFLIFSVLVAEQKVWILKKSTKYDFVGVSTTPGKSIESPYSCSGSFVVVVGIFAFLAYQIYKHFHVTYMFQDSITIPFSFCLYRF